MHRPPELLSEVPRIPTGHGMMYLRVSEHDGRPVELIATIGKSGGSIAVKGEVIGRLVTLCLQQNIPMAAIVDCLIGLQDEKPVAHKDTVIQSIPDGIGQWLQRRYL